MKRHFVLFILLIGIIIFLVQCKKEGIVNVNKEPQEEVSIDEITKRFQSDYLQFKTGNKLKSGKILTLEDAIFEMDATFNSTYAKANHSCGEIKTIETYVTLDMVNEKEANYDDVLASYSRSIEEVSDIFYALNKINKQLMMISIKDGGAESDNTRKLIIDLTIGFGSYQGDFGISDKFLFEESATYNCDGETAPSAPVVFETKMNEYFNTCPTAGCRYYFYGRTEHMTYAANSLTYLAGIEDNYLDYKIFYASTAVNVFDPVFTECLEYNQANLGIHEMQFYYDYYKAFAADWINSESNTYDLKYCPKSDVFSDDDTNAGIRIILHELRLVFRKRGVMCTVVEPLPL